MGQFILDNFLLILGCLFLWIITILVFVESLRK